MNYRLNEIGMCLVQATLDRHHKQRQDDLRPWRARVQIINREVALFSLAGCETVSGRMVAQELGPECIDSLS